MALSASRIAAFEFLIQFRSIGRNRVRGALVDFKKLRGASKSTSIAIKDASLAARVYRDRLVAAGVGANRAAIAEAAYRNRILKTNAALRARSRGSASSRVRNFRQGGLLASQNPLARGASRLFGVKAGARVAAGVGKLSGAMATASKIGAKFIPIVGQVVAVLQLVAGVVLRIVGAIFQWAKVNLLIISGLGLLAVGLAKLADGFTNLINRIKVASDGTRSLKGQSNDLLGIALRSRAPFSTVADLYGRIALNAKGYGVSLAEAAKFTELAVKAAKIGGAQPRELEQAFLQLSQGLGSNRLSGDELRSVREQTPALAAYIARGLGVAIGDLKKLGESGELTTKKVVKALISQQRFIDIAFGKVEATFADGTLNIATSLKFFVGSVTSALKLGPKWFSFTSKISDKFAEMAKKSEVFALAISRLPTFFRSLGFNGLDRFFMLLKKIGDFFVNLPDSIQKAVDAVNNFTRVIESGGSVEDAAAAAGFTVSGLQDNNFLKNTNNVLESFITNLVALSKAMGALTTSIQGLVNLINGIAKIRSGILNIPGVRPATKFVVNAQPLALTARGLAKIGRGDEKD